MNSFLLICTAREKASCEVSCSTNIQNVHMLIINVLNPLVGSNGKLVIMGDFNVPVNDAVSPFICFMETLFGCSQHICQSTDHGS